MATVVRLPKEKSPVRPAGKVPRPPARAPMVEAKLEKQAAAGGAAGDGEACGSGDTAPRGSCSGAAALLGLRGPEGAAALPSPLLFLFRRKFPLSNIFSQFGSRVQ